MAFRFMKAVEACGGCSDTMIIDAGTENVHITNMQGFPHGDENSIIIGASHGKVKIERCWGL